jgi:transcriptional regulator with XRE-family HTH domain
MQYIVDSKYCFLINKIYSYAIYIFQILLLNFLYELFPMKDKDDLVKRIGTRLKELRKQSDLTLKQLAEMTELSSAILSRIENCLVMPSIQTLQAISSNLKVDIDYFFRREEEKGYEISYLESRNILFSRKEANGKITHEIEPLAEDFENSFMEPVVITFLAKDQSVDAELVTHEGQEFMYILEGKMMLTIGLDKFILKKGDAAYWNSTIPHSGRTVGKKPAKTLNVAFMPGTRTGAFQKKG